MTNTIIRTWKTIELSEDMTTRTSISNKDSSIVTTTQAMMSKATMHKKETTAK